VGVWGVLLFNAFLEERGRTKKLKGWSMDSSQRFFFSIKAMQIIFTLDVASKQRLHKLRFLKKVGCQKPCWDQAILSLTSWKNYAIKIYGEFFECLKVKQLSIQYKYINIKQIIFGPCRPSDIAEIILARKAPSFFSSFKFGLFTSYCFDVMQKYLQIYKSNKGKYFVVIEQNTILQSILHQGQRSPNKEG
jgi:hypothetical protein